MAENREGRVRLASVTQVSPLRIQFRASSDDVPVTFSSVPGIEVGDQVFAATQRHRVLVLAQASSPAGTNPFDARYVNKDGDTMTGGLNFGGQRIGEKSAGIDTERLEVQTSDSGTVVRLFVTGQGRDDSQVSGFEVRIDSGSGSATAFSVKGNGNVEVQNDFDVKGTKNALVPKKDDPTRALRFAATESNTPGIMEVYCGVHTVPQDRQLTLRPADLVGLQDEVRLVDYITIGRSPRVRLDSAGPREDAAPNAPYAWAEWNLDDPRIEIRAPAGDYHVELRFIRSDAETTGWTHEVDVLPEDEEV